MAKEDCWSKGLKTAGVMAAGSVPVGFFRAHATLKDLTLAEKMQRWQNVKLTAGIMAKPMATFAAAGLAFAATDCSMRNYMGREDVLTGVVGGLAAGAVMGLRTNNAGNALKYGALFAAGQVACDFLTRIAPNVLGDIKATGPMTITQDPAPVPARV